MITKDQQEVWENPNAGDVYVNKEDFQGKLISERVPGHQRFTITTRERRLNQEKAFAASAKNDLFTNGTLARVTLAESADDYEELVANVNTIGESELKDLMKVKGNAFKSKLKDIDNIRVLERMKAMTEDDGLDITKAQENALDARILEVDPEHGSLPVFFDYTNDKNKIPEIEI